MLQAQTEKEKLQTELEDLREQDVAEKAELFAELQAAQKPKPTDTPWPTIKTY